MQNRTDTLTASQAAALMQWVNCGTSCGVAMHRLYFFESQECFDRKQGHMCYATLTKGNYSTRGWVNESDQGEDEIVVIEKLAEAKKLAFDSALKKIQKDGYIDKESDLKIKKSAPKKDGRNLLIFDKLFAPLGKNASNNFHGFYLPIKDGSIELYKLDGSLEALVVNNPFNSYRSVVTARKGLQKSTT